MCVSLWRVIEMITPRDLAKADQLEAVLPLEKHLIITR
jgi:hypothetical protein